MRILIIFLFVFFELSTSAQLKKDSLYVVFNNNNNSDSIRLDALNKLAFNVFIGKNPDSTIFYSYILLDSALAWDQKKFQADAKNNLGVANNLKGNQNVALSFFNESLNLCKQIGYESGLANVYGNLGIVHRYRGEYEKALENYNYAYEIFQKRGSKSGIARTLNNMANIYYLTGDYNKALNYNLKSLFHKTEINDRKGIISSLNNIGQVYFIYADFVKAEEYFQRSLDLANQLEDRSGIVNATSNIANIYYEKGDYKRALEMHSTLYEQAVINGDQFSIAMALFNIAKDHVYLGNADTSIVLAKQSLEIAQKIHSPESIRAAARTLLHAYFLKEDFNQSNFYVEMLLNELTTGFKLNFPILSENEQKLYSKTLSHDYNYFYSYAMRVHENSPAASGLVYNQALIRKGLLLKSSTALRFSVMNSSDSLLIQNYAEWIKLKQELVAAYNRGDSTNVIEEKADQLEKDMIKRSDVFSAFRLNESVNWQTIQNYLKADEAAIEFITYRDKIKDNTQYYCASVLTSNCTYPYLVQLCSDAQLTNLIGNTQGNDERFIRKLYGTKAEPNQELYELIWKPLEKHLEGVKTVHISPVGNLHRLSFSAIADEQNILLCQRYNLNVKSGSAQILNEEKFEFTTTEPVQLYGGIDYEQSNSGNEIWQYLAGTQLETESISRILHRKKFKTITYTGNDASEGTFKREGQKASVIHIATHGFFYPDPQIILNDMNEDSVANSDLTFRGANYSYNAIVTNTNPMMRSGLVFAGANKIWSENLNSNSSSDDGVLTAQEVITMDLRKTGLVVLSACESGLGDVDMFDGVYGLQRAFKIAGARYLLISLWKVPDKETAEFMQTFYHYLIKTKSPQMAFLTTQREMRQKYDPYYWAAFTLIE